MLSSFNRGEIVYAKVPFNDDPTQGKRRPVVILGASPLTSRDDQVVLIAQVTSFGDGGRALNGDVEILEWGSIGLPKRSWIRARRLWGANPRACSPFDPQGGVVPRVSDFTLSRVLREINELL